jgi:NAD(P)-dependent dehydrogenase (short-subunit alcohol dehydrogenase family)
MKKYAIIIGASGGIGSGFVRQLLKRGYTVYLQYRSDEALAELQKLFSGDQVRFFFSSLKDKKGLKEFLTACQENGIYFSIAVLAAGTWKADADFETVPESISKLSQINFETKQIFTDPFIEVYRGQKTPTKLVLISSHISDVTTAEAEILGQVGYVTAMKKVNALAKDIDLHSSDVFMVFLLKTKRVETKALQQVRQKHADVPEGENNEAYAEAELLKIAA